MTLAEKFNHNFENGAFKLFNSNGKLIYLENPNGYWFKYEYDLKGNQTYYENSNKYWSKYEYDSNGNEIYREYSNGYIEDNRPTSPCNGKIVEIDGKKYELKEV